MNFNYSGCDQSGRSCGGQIEAGDVVEAIDELRRRGLFVSKIAAAATGGAAVPAGGKPDENRPRRRRMGRGRLLRNLAMFTRQLYVLTTAGTALVDALRSLERQSRDGAWRDVVANVRTRVEQGSSLSEAMTAHPKCFDAVCRSLISSGETSGGLGKMLDRLATLTRKQVQLRSAILGAMIYPCLLIVVSLGVLGLMLLFVLPRFAGMFRSMDVPLPATTKFLMDLSALLQAWWWAILIGGVVAAIIGKLWSATPSGREIVHRVVLHVPIAGKLIRSLQVARIVRVLGVLVAGKVPLLQALGLARTTAGNLQYVHLMARAEAAVIAGSTMSSVMLDTPLIEPSLCEAIRSGEQSGEVGALLLNMADFLDEENELVVRSLTSILEPAILIVLGILVGFVAMSMFLPMFDMTSMVRR